MIVNVECKCNKPNPIGAKFCTHCGKIIPITSPKSSKTKVLICMVIVLLIFLGAASAYQYYPEWQNNQYKEKVKPLYSSLESLIKEQGNPFEKGGEYASLVDDTKRVNNAVADIKLRLQEIPATTKESQVIKNAFVKVCDVYSESLQLSLKFYEKNIAYKKAVDARNTPTLANVRYVWDDYFHKYVEKDNYAYYDWTNTAGTQDEVDKALQQKNDISMNLAARIRAVKFLQAILKEALFPDLDTSVNKAISLLDMQIPSMPELELINPISVDETGQLLGKRNSVQFDWNDSWAGAYASFEYGYIWIEYAKDTWTKGNIARVLISKPGFKTARGIQIGDSEQAVFEKYGQPGLTSKQPSNEYSGNSSKFVKWHRYFIKNEEMRIIFGIDVANNTVCSIGYSQTAGGI